MSITLIAAISSNAGLGKTNGELLFHIREDMKFFRDKTEGQICVFGRRTFESIISMRGEPLPKRTNCILTRDENYESLHGELAYNSIERIINHSQTLSTKDKKIMVCGGSEIYKLFMPYADEILLTHINRHVEDASVFYPMESQESHGFMPVEESEEYYTEKYDAYYKFVRYVRK
jgi:dihydrofolate reductase